MNSIEEYQNLVELLKKALEFYSDKNNYVYPNFSPATRKSMIELDGGSQAQFALDKAKELEASLQKMQEDYNKFISGYEQLQATEETVNPQELIKQLKLFADDNNI